MEKPVFIIGCPRSGTTILLNVLCAHDAFVWVSNLLNIFPNLLFLNIYNRIYRIKFAGNFLYKKKKNRWILPVPKEPWRFWDNYLSNFQWPRGGKIPPRRQNASDITHEEIANIRNTIKILCRYGNRSRFLSKYTDFPRINYLAQAFPDAQFIHIVRDGRAVAFSHYKRMVANQFHNWQEREWWIRGWPDEWGHDFKTKYNSQLSFSAYLYKFFLKEILEEAQSLPASQYLEIKYEDFTNSAENTLKYIWDFCELPLNKKVESFVEHVNLRNMNFKWRNELNSEQQQTLHDILCENIYRDLFDD